MLLWDGWPKNSWTPYFQKGPHFQYFLRRPHHRDLPTRQGRILTATTTPRRHKNKIEINEQSQIILFGKKLLTFLSVAKHDFLKTRLYKIFQNLQNLQQISKNNSSRFYLSIRDAFRDLVPFVQFKKREKNP